MRNRLTQSWKRCGGVISSDTSRPLHFGDPGAELRCALEGCVLADGSNLTRLLATGPDYLDLLQRLSTGDVASLGPRQGRPTILTTAKGRIVERLFVHCRDEGGVLSVAGPGAGARVIEHLSRYSFAEDLGLSEITHATFQFLLVGPRAVSAMEAIGLEPPEAFQLRPASIGGADVNILGQDGCSGDGFSIEGPDDLSAEVWDAFLPAVERAGGRPAGDEPIESRRVLRGLPASGHELTEEHNPLEAGQWEAVSFDKGCYVGQEVVARLRTYEKVSRALVGLDLPAGAALPARGAPLFDGGRRVGDLTSAVLPPDREAPVALGYVKRNALRVDLELRIGDDDDAVTARVVDLPFAH
jgi:folate-binding protein YgfZ